MKQKKQLYIIIILFIFSLILIGQVESVECNFSMVTGCTISSSMNLSNYYSYMNGTGGVPGIKLNSDNMTINCINATFYGSSIANSILFGTSSNLAKRNITINNCQVQSGYKYVVYIPENCSDIILNNISGYNNIYDSNTSSPVYIYVDRSSNITIQNINVKLINSTIIGIKSTDTQNIKLNTIIRNNNISGGYVNILVGGLNKSIYNNSLYNAEYTQWSLNANTLYNSSIYDNYVYNSTWLLGLQYSNYNNIYNNNIYCNNVASSHGLYAFYNANNNIFNNNNVSNCQFGLLQEYGANNNNFINNYVQSDNIALYDLQNSTFAVWINNTANCTQSSAIGFKIYASTAYKIQANTTIINTTFINCNKQYFISNQNETYQIQNLTIKEDDYFNITADSVVNATINIYPTLPFNTLKDILLSTYIIFNISNYTISLQSNQQFELVNYTNFTCTESWIQNNTICDSTSYTIKYYDANQCNTTTILPTDNATIIDCSTNYIRGGSSSSGSTRTITEEEYIPRITNIDLCYTPIKLDGCNYEIREIEKDNKNYCYTQTEAQKLIQTLTTSCNNIVDLKNNIQKISVNVDTEKISNSIDNTKNTIKNKTFIDQNKVNIILIIILLGLIIYYRKELLEVIS
jgi:hypothetical protein